MFGVRALALLVVVPSAAAADTAAPWTASFGRLVDPTAGPAAAPPPSVPLVHSGPDRDRALACLADAVAYEAGSESVAGQAAVADVVLNRVAHPAFPKSVCEVVYQGSTRRTGCQFSFTCDGSLRRPRTARTRAAALAVAARALDSAAGSAGGATHYHANYVRPYWAPSLIRLATVGAHIFYRFPGRVAAVRTPTARAPAAAVQFSPWGLALVPAQRDLPGTL